MDTRIVRLNQVTHGWVNYYCPADMQEQCRELDKWLRHRLRMCYWKQWKKIGTKHDNLVRLGIPTSKAWEFANTRKGYWRIACSPILSRSLTIDFFRRLGLSCLSDVYSKSISLRTAVCRTARTVVWEDSEWINHSLPTRSCWLRDCLKFTINSIYDLRLYWRMKIFEYQIKESNIWKWLRLTFLKNCKTVNRKSN